MKIRTFSKTELGSSTLANIALPGIVAGREGEVSLVRVGAGAESGPGDHFVVVPAVGVAGLHVALVVRPAGRGTWVQIFRMNWKHP